MKVDWPKLLGDIAYLQGEPDPQNASQRVPCSTVLLADHLGVARGTLRGWLDGSVPKHDEGERLIDVWCKLSGKSPTFLPREHHTLSASRVR